MELKQFTKLVFEKAKTYGFEECEVYFVKGDSMSIKVFNKDLNQFSNAVNHGLSFRGAINGKMGYAFTESLEENVIENLLENAKLNATLVENPDKEEIFKGAKEYHNFKVYDDSLNQITTEFKTQLVFDIEKYTYSLSDKVFQVSNCSINTGESEVYIANTKGLQVGYVSNLAYVVVGVIVKDGDSTKQHYDYWYGNDIKNFDYKKLCDGIVENALKRTNAKSVKSGKYDIILHKEAMISFLSSFSGVFSAKAVQDNLSLLKGKLGQKIASEKITIVDDGTLVDGKLPVPFDSEGYPTERTVLVDKGVLKSYLYNSKTALKDDVKSTGNGFKSSYKSTVTIQTTNFYLENGKTSYNNLKKQLNKGIIIDDLSGLHSGLNTVSGDFSLLASGFIVEDGEITKPVDQITIAGNFYDILKNVEEIADDIKYDMAGNATIASPSILVRGLDVSGE